MKSAGSFKLDIVPFPKFQLKVGSIPVERFLNETGPHVLSGVRVNLAEGASLTSIVFVNESIQPKGEVAMS